MNYNQNNQTSNTEEDNNFESVKSQFKSDISNINIYNIQNNINNISLYKEDNTHNVEKIANDYLKRILQTSNLHWLISGKDIVLGKQIGFGGSSEVYKADYRGTEVAVKKLRILEVKEENLKEFKREVSSLIMLRHPNLVLFMGAM
jgi:serine/threonine protein kinase